MANIVDSLGADFINKRFQHAMFLKDGDVYKVYTCRPNPLTGLYDTVSCKRLRDGKEENIRNDFFTGFKVFAYPRLGYRRLGTNSIGYAIKEQSAYRGLSMERVHVQDSPATRLLRGLGLNGDYDMKKRSIIIMQPEFDKLRDLPAVLAGEKSGLVLSESLIIEPDTKKAEGHFSVLFDQVEVATVTERGVYKWATPKYERHIKPMLEA